MTELEHLSCALDRDLEVDPAGRIPVCTRTREASPRFCFARTAFGNLWRFRADLDPDTVRALARLAGREPPIVVDLLASLPPERLEPLRRALAVEAALPARLCMWLDATASTFQPRSWNDRDARSELLAQGFTPIGDLYVFD